MPKLAHVITGLETGGAEMMLYRLLPHLRAAGLESVVFSLTGVGSIGARIAAAGFAVRALEMSPRLPSPLAVTRLAGWLRDLRPDVIQTWLYHGDLLGSLAAKMAGAGPVIWGVHTTRLDRAWVRRRTRLVAHVCAVLSRGLPARIVCCSPSAARMHRRIGYAADRLLVIENGVDTEIFIPSAEARRAVRGELGLPANATLIGLVARYHATKDHSTFIEAASRFQGDARFLLCGDGVAASNRGLQRRVEEAGLSHRVHLLGPRHDMPRIQASLDLATLSSRSEASPLALAEAMSCGVPCAATDVGDCRRIIGDTGLVVGPGDPGALAAAWQQLLTAPRDQRLARAEAARRRICDNFSLAGTARHYAALYEGLLR